MKRKHEDFKTNALNIAMGGYFNENPQLGNKRLSLFGYYQLKERQMQEVNFGPKSLRERRNKLNSLEISQVSNSDEDDQKTLNRSAIVNANDSMHLLASPTTQNELSMPNIIPRNQSELLLPNNRRYFGPKTLDYYREKKNRKSSQNKSSSYHESQMHIRRAGHSTDRNSIQIGVEYQDVYDMIET